MKNLSIRKMNEMTKKKKKGFTLVELIIVIAIIAILAAMAIPKFSAIRTDAKVSNDVAAAKNISTIAATLIANGVITPGEVTDLDIATDGAKGKEIRDRLDGTAKNGKGEASGKSFILTVASDESITVKCAGATLYPDADKVNYTTASKSGTDYAPPTE